MQDMEEPLSSGEIESAASELGKTPVIIPESATIAKPKFFEFDEALQAGKAIAAFIRKEGRVRIDQGVRYLNAHPDETYSKPPANAKVEYLAEFVLPDNQRAPRWHSPCPLCWFEHSKFVHGMVAWFRDEAVIRVIGPDCFRTLSPESHETALKNYRARKKRERNIANILRNIPKIGAIRDAIEHNLEIAIALDRVRDELIDALDVHGIRLWPAIRGNWLRRVKSIKQKSVSTSGGMREKRVSTYVNYAPFRGAQLISGASKPLADDLRQCLAILKPIEATQTYYQEVELADDRMREQLARAMGNAFKTLAKVEKDMVERLRFVSMTTLMSLRSWTQLDDAELQFFVELSDDDSVLMIGSSLGNFERIRIDGALRENVESMAPITEKDLN